MTSKNPFWPKNDTENKQAGKKAYLGEEMPSSLVALINCNIEKVIRAFVDLLKVNESNLDSCDTMKKGPQSMFNNI